MRSAIIALLLAISAPASAGPREAPLLLDTIAAWLSANFHLPAVEDGPALHAISDARLAEMRYGPDATVEPGRVVATYDDEAGTIYLSESWSGRTPAEVSVLVHEMVHHIQAASGQRFACAAEREKLAYQAQDAWLRLFGQSLETAFGIDPAMVLVSTVCTY